MQKRLLSLPILLLTSFLMSSCTEQKYQTEIQVTHNNENHLLTNFNVWFPDSQWLAYDTRNIGGDFDCSTIKRVNINTREIETLYTAPNNAKVGVVTCDPKSNRVVFIQGPDNPTADWTYSFTRRRGIMIDADKPNQPIPLEATAYVPPFIPGSLRGGTHVHMFNPAGTMVSSTYEDNVLAALDINPASPAHHPNQRNIAIHILNKNPGEIPATSPRNHNGTAFSVLVTSTVANPKPGSDEISRAFEECWIGNNGYLRADGSRQVNALAFLGNVTTADGKQHPEIFIVDLPENLDDLTIAQSPDKPLAGTPTTLPNPPKGVTQRRITFTENGVATKPRHWLRSSPDGSQIAFLMNDAAGIPQVWLISPNGGLPRQLSHLKTPVASCISWSPDNKYIGFITDNAPAFIDAKTGVAALLTAPRPEAPASVDCCNFSPDGQKLAYARKLDGVYQIFYVPIPTE